MRGFDHTKEGRHMTISVVSHQHQPVLVFEAEGRKLLLQTGTLVFDFQGSPAGDWNRQTLSHPVLQLPPGNASVGTVRAIAAATPASILYSPPVATGASDGATGLFAQGLIRSTGFAQDGIVETFGNANLAVSRRGPGASVSVPLPQAGWAVDRTQTLHSFDQLLLVVDLAVAGPASFFRLAYSLFVTLSPRLVVADNPVHHIDP
jgi:hypothetical protein